MTTTTTDVEREVDRQRAVLADGGVPQSLGLDRGSFDTAVRELLPVLARCAEGEASPARVPFVLVVAGAGPEEDMAAAERHVPALRLVGSRRPGVLDRNHGEQGLAPYRPIEAVGPAPARVYALLDVQRGEEFCGVRPQDALPVITARGRSPLTIPEGIALVSTHPQVLEKNACFMLSGSRRGDRRVPALWISQRAPKLGWCWDGNPHTWLGVASTAARVGAG